MPERKDSYAREGDPTQRTKTGLVIGVPTRRTFFGALKKAARGKVPKAAAKRGKE